MNYYAALSTSWPWYLTRASGIVAGLLLVCLLVTGITAYTGHQFKFIEPIKAWANHRTLGIAFIAAVGVHALSIRFDTFVGFSLLETSVPFVSDYKQVDVFGLEVSLGMALGILASYALAALALTTWKLMRGSPKIWKVFHYLAYVIVVSVFFHSILLGTEFKNVLWRGLWIGVHIIVLGFVALRLRSAGALR